MTTDQRTNRQSNPEPHLSDETLSEFASGRLIEPERLAALHHAETCAHCRQALRDYSALTSLLGALPAPRPKRNFQLSEEQARSRSRFGGRFPSLMLSLPVLRVATLAVAMLLLIVAGADRLTRPGGHSANREQSAAMLAPSETALAPRVATIEPAAPTNAPLVAGANSDVATDQTPLVGSNPPTNESIIEAGAAAPAAAVGSSGSGADSAVGSTGNESSGGGSAFTRATVAKRGLSPGPEATPEPIETATAVANSSPAPTITPAPAATPIVIAATSGGGNSSRTGWRVIELGLALLLVWLIVSCIGARRTSGTEP